VRTDADGTSSGFAAVNWDISGTDAGLFAIDGTYGFLTFNSAPDFEAPSDANHDNVYELNVIAHNGDVSDTQELEVTVTDVNEAPEDLLLSNNEVSENVPVGSAVGSLSTTDPDAGDSFAYNLVSGEGSTDNASFIILGNTVTTFVALDYSTKNTYTIRVRSTDSTGLKVEKAFTINVTEVNVAPTDITLSASSVAENTASGETVGTFGTTDNNIGYNSFTYSLSAGEGDTDNSSFTIDGNELKLGFTPDFETKNSYSIRVRTTDGGGLTCDKQFTITITDANDAPIITSGAAASFVENSTDSVFSAAAADQDGDIII
jgi:hypothetical protein